MAFEDEEESQLSESDNEGDSDLGVSSHEESSSTNHGTSSGSMGDDFREVRNYTRKETKDVETWRDLVTGVLVITACLVTMASFIYLSRNETESFKLAVCLSVALFMDGSDVDNPMES